MTAFRVQARRTTASGPPADLEFGELAYSDTDQQLYVGRADGEQPPTTFDSTPTDYGPAIAALNSTTSDQADVIAALSTNDTDQDTAIAALILNDGAQDTAISGLINNTSIQSAAFSALATDTQAALATKANQADLALVATSGAYDDLSGKPTLFSGAYADLSGKPTLFSGAYADLSGKPTIPAGFTFDQQSEPISPAAGVTWRERSSGGLIVGEWQWDHEALRWVELITRSQTFNVAGTGQTFTPFAAQSGILDPLATILYLGFKGIFWITTTANASNYYEQRMMSLQKETASESFVTGGAFTYLSPNSAAITVPNTNVAYSVSTKQLISRPGGLIGFRSWVFSVGSPGSFRSIGSVLFKNVRPV